MAENNPPARPVSYLAVNIQDELPPKHKWVFCKDPNFNDELSVATLRDDGEFRTVNGDTIHPDWWLKPISSNWISVAERLPDINERVLICVEREFKSDPRVIIGWRLQGENQWASSVAHEDELLYTSHWQPLPVPPEK